MTTVCRQKLRDILTEAATALPPPSQECCDFRVIRSCCLSEFGVPGGCHWHPPVPFDSLENNGLIHTKPFAGVCACSSTSTAQWPAWPPAKLYVPHHVCYRCAVCLLPDFMTARADTSRTQEIQTAATCVRQTRAKRLILLKGLNLCVAQQDVCPSVDLD